MSQGQLSDLFAAYPGNPQGVNPSIFNCKKGTLVVDTVSAVLYQKISQINDNSEYQQIGTTSSGGTTIQVTSTDTDSFGTAVTAALALTPSESNRVTILLPLDEYTQATNVTITSPYLTIQGNGKNATKVTFTSTAQLSIGAANVTLQSFHITRSGGSATAPLTTTVTSLATFLDGVELNDMRISNPSTAGVAIQTFAGKSHNCTIDNCTTGIFQNYGGINESLTVTAAQYAVRYSQSAAPHASTAFADSRPALFDNCKLTQTDTTGGHVIQGLVESITMNQVTTADINWFGTRVIGGKIHAACVASGTAATSEAVRGAVHLFGVGVDGDRFTTFWFDSYANACYFSAQNSNATTLMSGVENCTITGGSIVCSTSTKVFTFLSNSLLNGVSFEADPTTMIGFEQPKLLNCVSILGGGLIGWQRKDLALLVRNTDSYAKVAATTAFNLATCTVEAWVKLKTTGDDNYGIFCSTHQTLSRRGFFLAAQRSTNQLYGGFNTGGGGTGISSTAASALFDGAWHHVAITLTGGTHKLWLDGTELDSDTGATPTGTNPLFIGGFTDTAGASPTMGYQLNGMIRNFRISNSVRTFSTLPTRFYPDSNTVLLVGEYTSGPSVWTDQVGLSDVTLSGGIPLWVRQAYTP